MIQGIPFLKMGEIIEAHSVTIENFGGEPGIRDKNALDSALSQPEQTFDGEYLHSCPFGMAAAYGFHICQNHPFIDGNKRTAILAMIRFLALMDYFPEVKPGEITKMMLQVATGIIGKDQLEKWLSLNCVSRDFGEF